jgi:hypothetical protein
MRVFKVKIHLKDGSHNVYNIVANDDLEARSKAEQMEKQSFKELSHAPYPGTDYCETEIVCRLDAN